MTIRTRFSPSPTGMIHLGNARAALFSALFAKKNNGVFILRIEDTDIARSEERYIESLQDDLHWLGIKWQEGLGVDGAYGPYRQSQRQTIYNNYFTQLQEKNLVYPCFCTDQELLLSRKLQLSRGQAPRYAGVCRRLTAEEVEKRIQAGKKPAWRFIVPEHVMIEFIDLVKGPQQFNSSDIGDFIIRRADGSAPFLFCNAIDDAMMKISHVIRGEDHVANTPRQVLLFQALRLPIPHYAHLSLIVGGDGAPLSKRHGSYSLHDLRSSGFLASAILNYLVRLGHTSDVQALLSFDQLAAYFHLDKLSKSPARFDLSQLMYWQKTAVQALDSASAVRWLGKEALSQVPDNRMSLFIETVQANIEFPTDALEWAKIFFHEQVTLTDETQHIIQEAGEQFFVEAEQAVDKYGIELPLILNDMKQTLGISGKKLFMPLRVALTGKIHGPELLHIAKLLGPEKMKHRLGRAVRVANGEASC
ncbi:MAG: glutamate--tRNA ligase [Gammaproteobacteria bacterium RIFCSPHIGHO2_12_FULL_37_34]|nr:MAG: glutamate--tRNA ligase [Gammaproteobacteria bacterium RIFCSPHIGHO2_12_FULL_37_34]